jgi:hypothetical protein
MVRFFAALISALILISTPMTSLAQDEARGDAGTIASDMASDGEQNLPAGWFLMTGRFGMASGSGGGDFKFDEVPRGEDDETSFESSHSWMNSTGIDALFFPTQSRGFMVSASLSRTAGTAVMSFEDDEYGKVIGLHDRTIQYYNWNLMGGVGYRWLHGWEDRNASIAYFKFGPGIADMAIDGFASSTGGSGAFEFGYTYLRRFDDRMAVGFQFDLHVWFAGFEGVEFDQGGRESEFDMGYGGGAGIVSFVIGWEM